MFQSPHNNISYINRITLVRKLYASIVGVLIIKLISLFIIIFIFNDDDCPNNSIVWIAIYIAITFLIILCLGSKTDHNDDHFWGNIFMIGFMFSLIICDIIGMYSIHDPKNTCKIIYELIKCAMIIDIIINMLTCIFIYYFEIYEPIFFNTENDEERQIIPNIKNILPIHIYHNNTQTNKLCAICINEFVENEQIKILNCSHIYHANCIDQWLWLKRICPLCRNEIKVPGYAAKRNI